VAGGKEVMEGAGVRLKRIIGTHELEDVDPFLLLDEFRSDKPGDYIAGFPTHPHRGFETVTYMLEGFMEHKDSSGESGILKPGGAQWMTAGRGILHSEMPKQEDGLLWGFQLWVNLPADKKMTEPRYQNIEPEDIPEIKRDDGAVIRVIAGEVMETTGAVTGIATDPLYIDVTLPPKSVFKQNVPKGHSAFIYTIDGAGLLDGANEEKIGAMTGNIALFSDGDYIEVGAVDRQIRFLLLAARPLNEPVVRYGPFVMNTKEEIEQAFDDYKNGKLTV
jgi:hypothetical protein